MVKNMIHKSMYLCLFELNFDEVFAANMCIWMAAIV